MLLLGLSFAATPPLDDGGSPPPDPGNGHWQFDETVLTALPSADGWGFLDTLLTEMEDAS
ncbi:MAG: hypothetical protein AAFO93_15070 [Pseudomonadota bacterium]